MNSFPRVRGEGWDGGAPRSGTVIACLKATAGEGGYGPRFPLYSGPRHAREHKQDRKGTSVEILQNRHSNRIRYAFGEDEVQYSIQDSSGSRSFSVAYSDISRDRQTFIERNAWLRNAGLLWLALGAVITAMAAIRGEFAPSMWIFIGAGCYAVYRFRTTHFTIVPSGKGNLLVIDGDEGQRILKEIESRRADYYRREYDFMPQDETPEQHRNRFKWLHREGALSEEELKQRLAVVDASDPVRLEAATPTAGAMLN